ncbi:hypothetical protein [Lysobacter sp. A03]|uniref:hypothetical protein n=1 Tax=Lysobacter sp. A03 TaxID=1199154 RepID=UPI0005B6A97A|nr:hypothetical protein [Lysobacter sp. A03]KIQ98037.1 hypothetical protein TI01_0388 [Lysobacter sp. A03]
MDPILKTGLIITLVGLVILIIGYTRRESRSGPLLMWAGVTTMIGVVVYYILRKLGI